MAVIALAINVLIMAAIYAITNIPLNTNFIAAMLTVVGYSINNTIVVYDRIRENRNLYGNSLSLKELVNMSITQSITRSVNTTVTTAFAVLAICVVCAICGVTSIMTFAIPMMAGLICGTYSSLCISGPLWVLWQEKHGKNYTNAGNGESKKDTKNLASKGTVDTKKLMV